MSKSVLISVNPEWCELIASGNKTGELRKTKPKLETPFKCYLYCTKPRKSGDIFLVGGKHPVQGNGKVIGEFMCNEISELYIACDVHDELPSRPREYWLEWDEEHDIPNEVCLSVKEIMAYLGESYRGYTLHISDLVIYDKPRELSEFKQCHKCEYYADCYEHEYSCDGVYNLTRPPQSWCYVEVT